MKWLVYTIATVERAYEVEAANPAEARDRSVNETPVSETDVNEEITGICNRKAGVGSIMNTQRKFVPDPDLPRPSWGGPVDLVRRFETPDGRWRTLSCGTYSSPMVAQEAARESYGIVVWVSTGDGRWRSAGDEYAIQPVRGT